jgi:hypothetical protein
MSDGSRQVETPHLPRASKRALIVDRDLTQVAEVGLAIALDDVGLPVCGRPAVDGIAADGNGNQGRIALYQGRIHR